MFVYIIVFDTSTLGFHTEVAKFTATHTHNYYYYITKTDGYLLLDLIGGNVSVLSFRTKFLMKFK